MPVDPSSAFPPIPGRIRDAEARETYPESDGLPMSENTEQFDFIQLFQANLNHLIPDFVAGDHLWYPVEGDPKTRIGPDVYVVIGRPKGHRGSYRQWEEGGVPLTVVFEWWSPKNTFAHKVDKLRFFERFGVQEFYTYDQASRTMAAFHRQGDSLEPVALGDDGVVSPILGCRFAVQGKTLMGWGPDGQRFKTLGEVVDERERAAAGMMQAEARAREAEQARDRAEQETAALLARLRELGVDDQV